MGPRSRDLLARLTRADLSNAAFPFATSREIWLGRAPVRASRITYVGELGWELYVPVEFAAGVYDALHEAGGDLGLADAGYYAIDSLRIEKAYRAWGRELTTDDTPLEAGLGFAVRFDKAVPFIGREALSGAARQASREAARQLRARRSRARCRWATSRSGARAPSWAPPRSAAYGHTLGRAVAWATSGGPRASTRRISTRRASRSRSPATAFAARGSLRAPYDPDGLSHQELARG